MLVGIVKKDYICKQKKLMIYSRHNLDKAGEYLLGDDPFKRNEALEKIRKWRETHLFVLQRFYDHLKIYLETTGVKYSFSSMRLKRMTSIEAKLRNNKSKGMKLGGLQDIGGARIVVEDIQSLDNLSCVLESFHPNDFTLVKEKDYVRCPKESGYRSIHYVYKYSSENKCYDGLSIELQARTKLQHSWAMAVETASLISQTTLKADVNDGSEWRDFFKLVSALFSKDEDKPILPLYNKINDVDLCKEYFHYDESKFIDQLQALRVTVSLDFKTIKGGYCVLIIDFKKKMVHAQSFINEQEADAISLFNKIEQNINTDEAALMVAIEDIKEIKEAYPSYFLDTKNFLDFLMRYGNECKLKVYEQ